jgi:hypothetical protein
MHTRLILGTKLVEDVFVNILSHKSPRGWSRQHVIPLHHLILYHKGKLPAFFLWVRPDVLFWGGPIGCANKDCIVDATRSFIATVQTIQLQQERDCYSHTGLRLCGADRKCQQSGSTASGYIVLLTPRDVSLLPCKQLSCSRNGTVTATLVFGVVASYVVARVDDKSDYLIVAKLRTGRKRKTYCVLSF